ncbi:MAG: rhodanese-like domain-containing protein [Zoogloeaceae bacterium]|jgi:rhodanese-related sulfurtransferase|nr:rhodanese-like domain-containing protein [Zoogloeaceae bacterium]
MEFIQNNILTIAIAVISGVMLVWPGLHQRGKALSAQQATTRINREDAIVIDVRETSEFTTGHLPEARNIPAKDITARIAELADLKEKPLIVVCASGVRSGQISAQLKKQGFTDAGFLEGGIDAWKRANLPLTRNKK